MGEHNTAERAAAAQIIKEEQAEWNEWHAYRQSLPVIAQIKDAAFDRLRYDHAYNSLHEDADLDGLAALAVHKTIDLLLGGMKDIVSPERLEACLAHMKRGSGK